uniref:Uncharacterized protein n=1 Tax=Triticum urartu TaxID=4572 RepID=A0A8R7QJ20_TRIUA
MEAKAQSGFVPPMRGSSDQPNDRPYAPAEASQKAPSPSRAKASSTGTTPEPSNGNNSSRTPYKAE